MKYKLFKPFLSLRQSQYHFHHRLLFLTKETGISGASTAFPITRINQHPRRNTNYDYEKSRGYYQKHKVLQIKSFILLILGCLKYFLVV